MKNKDVKAVMIVPEGYPYVGDKTDKLCIGVTWPDNDQPTHKVIITRTSNFEDIFESECRIPLSALGGLLDKMYDLTEHIQLIVSFSVQGEENIIRIEVYDDYRE